MQVWLLVAFVLRRLLQRPGSEPDPDVPHPRLAVLTILSCVLFYAEEHELARGTAVAMALYAMLTKPSAIVDLFALASLSLMDRDLERAILIGACATCSCQFVVCERFAWFVQVATTAYDLVTDSVRARPECCIAALAVNLTMIKILMAVVIVRLRGGSCVNHFRK